MLRSPRRTGKLKKRIKSDTNREVRGLGASWRLVPPNMLKAVVSSSGRLLRGLGGDRAGMDTGTHGFPLGPFPLLPSPPILPPRQEGRALQSG